MITSIRSILPRGGALPTGLALSLEEHEIDPAVVRGALPRRKGWPRTLSGVCGGALGAVGVALLEVGG